jgi:type I restriction enzyme, S subunit
MSSYGTKSIRDVTKVLIDYRGKTPTKTRSGVKLITAKVIKGGFIVDGDHEYIADEAYDTWMRRGLPCQWDILITTEAPLGEVAQLRTSEKVALAQRVILLRGDSSIIHQGYFFHALKSPFVQAGLRARSSGTTVLGIKQSELWQVQIPCPPLPIQERIASILSAYDDLVANNTRRIKILEEMAQRTYGEWFVNFRFPGHEKVRTVESATGRIPDGWSIVTLKDVAGVNEQSLQPGNGIEEIVYIDIASVSTASIDNKVRMVFDESPSRARRIVRHGDIIWSTVRPNRRSYSLILEPEPNLIVSTGFAVLTAHAVPYSYLYFATTTDAFAEYLTNHATGSAYPAVNAGDFEKAKLLKPPARLLNQFHAIAADMMNLSHCLHLRNLKLRQTRDLLLPKLISGEVSVKQIEAEAVAQGV